MHEKHGQGKLQAGAARGQWSGLGRQQTHADRASILGKDDIGRRDSGDTCAGKAADKLSSRYRHPILRRNFTIEYPLSFFLWLQRLIGRKLCMIKCYTSQRVDALGTLTAPNGVAPFYSVRLLDRFV